MRAFALALSVAVVGCGTQDNSGSGETIFDPTNASSTSEETSASDPSADESDETSTDPTATTVDPETGESSDTGPVGGPAGSCGMGGGTNEILQINLGSPERWYLIGAPNTDEPLPVVVAFHGDEGDPFNSTRFIWGSYWETGPLPFIVVMTKCPGCESWYQGDTDANADYVWEVLADVAANHNVDVSRIYAVGYSGGSEFLSMHGWEFQSAFAAIQFTCGGNAYFPYTPAPREDCKVRGRIVISADDFLWASAQDLLARLQTEGHINDYVDAQCSGHCCDTPDHNSGAWAWFQTHTKCGGIVPGMCAEVTDLPSAGGDIEPDTRIAAPPLAPISSEHPIVAPAPPDFDAAVANFDAVMLDLEGATADRDLLFREAMAAYDMMLAAAHTRGPDAKDELKARYPRLRELMSVR